MNTEKNDFITENTSDSDLLLRRMHDVYDFLERLSISYEKIEHEPVMTVADIADLDRRLGCTICKNLFLCNQKKNEYYLLMMQPDKHLKSGLLSNQLGTSRLSFASGDEMEKLLNTSPGSLSVLGIMFDTAKKVTLLIDYDLDKCEYIGCHPCVNTATLKLKMCDLTEKFLKFSDHIPIYVTL